MRPRSAIPTAAVLAGLGGLAAAALSSQPGSDGAATAAATVPPRTRTLRAVEVHTITRVLHDLPPARPRPAVAASPAAPSVPAPVAAAPAPVVRETPVSRPLRTRASGAPGARRGGDGAEHDGRERRGHEQDD
ncbi:MAG: hypothetical protein JSS99_06975 [Actinobacteria bacterium]|nr:hypothetical protein [Actinomycetota bacterium]